jgi:hypothetical protein
MKKLMPLLTAILIGLSLLGCDPEETFYFYSYRIIFQNDTDKKIKLIYYDLNSDGTGIESIIDTFILNSNARIYFGDGASKESILEDNFELIIKEAVNIFNNTPNDSKFELYVENEFIKEWKGKANYLGNTINSPYNYDSWELVKYEKVLNPSYGEFIYGEIIFTIRDEDLEVKEKE